MFNPFIHITIGRYIFTLVHKVSVESSWQNLTDTATILLPKNIKINYNQLRNEIKVGDRVEISAGYDFPANVVFKGYVIGILPKVPIEIKCEDESWKLKQNTITDTIRNATVQNVLNKYFKDYKTKCLNTKLGTYQINKASKAQILKSLSDQYGLKSFFRNDVLVVGLPYDKETAQKHKFAFQRNIKSHNLEYKRKEDIRIKVTAISNIPNGSKLEYECGDVDGEQRTLNYYNLSMNELKEIAHREMDKLKYDGYHGNFTAFFEPFVHHGDIVELIDYDETDKAGKYWVDAVSYEMGINGMSQTIKLGPKA